MSSSTIKKKYTSKISEIKKHNQYYFEKIIRKFLIENTIN